MLCQICHTNTAVLFVSSIENGQPKQLAMCLSCARKQGIPLHNLMQGPGGINQEELDNIGKQMNELMEQMQEDGSLEGLSQMIPPQFLNMLKGATHPGEDDEDEPGEDDLSPSASASAPSQDEKSTQEEDPAQAKAKARRKRNERLKTLSKFGTNLTDKAEDGEIDGVIGRENEIDRLMQILNRRTTNNPVLLGAPRVGKPAIAEGFALKIARGEVPVKLRDKQVVLLDMTGLVAGTQFRGRFEQLPRMSFSSLMKSIIWLVPEMHRTQCMQPIF